MEILSSLRRRSLWQILALYVVAGWIALEVVTTLTEALGLPDWFPAFGFVLLIIGFPVVLAVAILEGRRDAARGPEHVHQGRAAPVREGDRRSHPGATGASTTESSGLAADAPGAAAGSDRYADVGHYGDAEPPSGAVSPGDPGPAVGARGARPTPSSSAWAPDRIFTWRNAILGGVGALALWGAAAGGWLLLGGATPDRGGGAAAASVAALPFANLSADEDDRYFADGVHEEILTRLSKIGALRVISRTSVMGYRGSERRLGDIADELGVRYVLEGSVRRGSNVLRVTAQLIDAETDEHVWAETYDRSPEDLLAIQSDVAERIAQALHAEITPEERARIAARPTDDIEAYDLYLRALDYGRTGEAADFVAQGRNWRLAVDLLRRALERDPEFALAWAELGYRHVELVWFSHDPTDARRELSRQAVERAVELEPDLGEARLAKGWYHYHGYRDYDAALAEAELASAALPGDPLLASLIGSVERRKGNYEVALREFGRAAELDPRNAAWPREMAGTAAWGLGRLDEARGAWARARALAPDWAAVYAERAVTEIKLAGDADAARRELEAWERIGGASEPIIAQAYFDVDLARRDHGALLARFDSLDARVLELQDDALPVPLLRARALALAGRQDEARAAYRRALELLRERATGQPDYAGVLQNLAVARAGLGDAEGARRDVARLLELVPIDLDRFLGPVHAQNAALALALAGDRDGAMAILGTIAPMAYPQKLTTPRMLSAHPDWDSLRTHPGFEALVASANPVARTGGNR
jgi:TolB-like protein/Flp pilus assembly protein TadD